MKELSVVNLAAAYHFAAVHHVDQRRKGRRAEPYVNNLIEVADLVAHASAGDLQLTIAAELHDAIEDVGVSEAEIAVRFGAATAALVV